MKPSLKLEDCHKIWRNADAVCLDVDSTVITGEGLDDLAKFCGCGEEVAKWTAKAMGEGISFREALEARLNLFKPNRKKGILWLTVFSQVEEFMRMNPPTLTRNVKDLTALLKSRDVPVFLISGGFHSIVDHVAKELGIPFNRVFANRLLHTDQGDYIGFDKDEPTSASHGKAKVVEHLKFKYQYKQLVMIGDGLTDFEAFPPADLFIGFGGNMVRQSVLEKAPWFVYDFQELIDTLKDEGIDSSKESN
eukprot:gene15492-6745_t